MTHSSLRDFDRPADRIRMHLQSSTSVALVVEGEDDVLVLKPHIERAFFFPVGGKKNVIATLTTLTIGGTEAVVGIIDRDFDGELGLGSESGALLAYDGVDLEEMLVNLGVLAELLEHFGSRVKLAERGGARTIVESIRQCVEPISRLRSLNSSKNLGLVFDAVDIQKKVDRKNLTLNSVAYRMALVATAAVSGAELERLIAMNPPAEQGHSGKDLAAVAGVALRHIVGTLPLAASTTEIVCQQLRAMSGLALSRSEWIVQIQAEIDRRSG